MTHIPSKKLFQKSVTGSRRLPPLFVERQSKDRTNSHTEPSHMSPTQSVATPVLMDPFQVFGNRSGTRNATTRRIKHHEVENADGETNLPREQVLPQAIHIPLVVKVTNSSRVSQFERVLQTGINRHTLIVMLFTGLLLFIALFLNASNAAVFAGIISYLVGTLVSSITFHQAIQNAVRRDAKS